MSGYVSHLLAECSSVLVSLSATLLSDDSGHQKPQIYFPSVWQPQREKMVPVPTVLTVIQRWLSFDQLGSCQLLTNHCGLSVAHIFQTDLSLRFSPVPTEWGLSYLNHKDWDLVNGSFQGKWTIYRRINKFLAGSFTARLLMFFSWRIIIIWIVLSNQNGSGNFHPQYRRDWSFDFQNFCFSEVL